MCKYCDNWKEHNSEDCYSAQLETFGDNFGIYSEKGNPIISFSPLDGYMQKATINYCPICGKRLV